MTVFVLSIYGQVVRVFRTYEAATRYRRHHYDQDEWRIYECQVRDD